MKIIPTLIRLMRDFPWALPAVIALGLLSSLAEGVGIGLLIPLLGIVVGDEASAQSGAPFVARAQSYAAAFSEDTRLLFLAASVVALVAIKAVVVYANRGLGTWINGRVSHDLRVALFRQLLNVGHLFLVRNDLGKLLNTIETETWRASEALAVLFSMIISACAVVALTGLLLLISWRMTVMVAAGMLLLALLVRLVARWAWRRGNLEVSSNAALSQTLFDGLHSMRLIRLFGQEAREEERFRHDSDQVRRAALAVDMITNLVEPVSEILYVLLFLTIVTVAWWSGVGLAPLFASLLLLYRLQPHIRALDHCRVELAGLAAAVEDVTALRDEADKPYVRSGTRPFAGLRRGIVFENVTFDYHGHSLSLPSLKKVSFRIGCGEMTAIVGGSGAGKSTIINLIYRLFDPQEGRLRVDGVLLEDLDLMAWRASLAIAGQDADLKNDTISNNIAYGRANAARGDVIEAAKKAAAHDFIVALSQGYDSRVGDRGLRLSAGQRQRIGLARALLREPDILILDEATNALDSSTEDAIDAALQRLRGHLTMIVVAHRLSTIRASDHVVVLDDGEVVEAGPPHVLLSRDGAFTRLFERQLLDTRA